MRSGLRAILEDEAGFELVGEAADGQLAVELARTRRADVVIMDIRMPRLDGLAATRQLAGPGVTHRVEVIVVTTFDLDEYVFGALQAGASGFLLKDASPETLIGAIRAVARGHGLVAPEVTRRLITRFAAVSPDPGRARELVALSDREREVLIEVARGSSNAEIGSRLSIEESTVKSHVSSLLLKLGLRSRVQAAPPLTRPALSPQRPQTPAGDRSAYLITESAARRGPLADGGYRALVAVRLTCPGDELAAFTESLSAAQPAPKQRAAIMLEGATAARQDGAARRDSDRIDESFRLAREALGPGTAYSSERAIRARSARPASVTVSRTASPAISAPAFSAAPVPGKSREPSGGHTGMDARLDRKRQARARPGTGTGTPSSGYPHRSLALIPVRQASVDPAT